MFFVPIEYWNYSLEFVFLPNFKPFLLVLAWAKTNFEVFSVIKVHENGIQFEKMIFAPSCGACCASCLFYHVA